MSEFRGLANLADCRECVPGLRCRKVASQLEKFPPDNEFWAGNPAQQLGPSLLWHARDNKKSERANEKRVAVRAGS